MTQFHQIGWRRAGMLCAVAVALLCVAGCSGRRSEQYRAEGDTLRGLDRIAEARGAYDKALEANPDNPMAKLGLARCDVAEGNTDEALARFKEALALDIGLEPAYAEAISMLVSANRMEEALEMSTTFAAQAPEAGGTARGVVLMKMGRDDEAIEVLAGLAEEYPDSGEIKIDLAAALLKGDGTRRPRPCLSPSRRENLRSVWLPAWAWPTSTVPRGGLMNWFKSLPPWPRPVGRSKPQAGLCTRTLTRGKA